MQVRTQLVVVALVAAGWGAGNATVMRPVMAAVPQVDRCSLGLLESLVAQNPDDVAAARALSTRYLQLDMPRLVIDTVARMSTSVQQDGQVAFNVARAHERLGDLQSASAILTGTLQRCSTIPPELADGAGCDVRTQTALAIESAAVDRMIQWHITPVTDPDRAALAREMASRPVRLVSLQ